MYTCSVNILLLFLLSLMFDSFDEIAAATMQSVWGRSPRNFQAIVIPHILRMMAGVLRPDPVLLVQSTGSGKSAVPLTLASVDGGVSIIIQNTLALGSDQCSKIAMLSASSSKPVKAFQLDTFKNIDELEKLCTYVIQHCTSNTITSIIIFTSSEALLKPVVISFVDSLVTKGLLRIFCINEIHLFVQFGLSFRKKFQQIRTAIVNTLRQPGTNYLKIPIILMTATLDNT